MDNNIKTCKNNVSYFEAGFKAAMLLLGGMSAEEVEDKFCYSLFYPSLVREAVKIYDSEEDGEKGIKKMLESLLKPVGK